MPEKGSYMLKRIIAVAIAGLSAIAMGAEMRLIRNGIVLDKLPDGLFGAPNNPGGIARTASGEWVTVIRSGEDSVQDSTLIYGSKDQGRSWYHIRTLRETNPTRATTYYVYQLPDNKQLFIELIVQHTRRPQSYADMVRNNLRK